MQVYFFPTQKIKILMESFVFRSLHSKKETLMLFRNKFVGFVNMTEYILKLGMKEHFLFFFFLKIGLSAKGQFLPESLHSLKNILIC